MIDRVRKVFIEGVYAYEGTDSDALIERALTEERANPYAMTVWESARVAPAAIAKRAATLGKKPRIVDVGAGTGGLSLALCARGFEMLAIDIDAGALELLALAAGEQNLSIETKTQDVFAHENKADFAEGDWFIFADLLYEKTLALDVAKCVEALLAKEKSVCVLSPKRLGRERFLKALTKDASFSHIDGVETKTDVQWCWL